MSFSRSAIAASLLLTVAVSPLLATLPTVDDHFPQLFDRMFFLTYIGMPGMLIARVFGNIWNKATLPVAVVGSWLFYFGLFLMVEWLIRYVRRAGSKQ